MRCPICQTDEEFDFIEERFYVLAKTDEVIETDILSCRECKSGVESDRKGNIINVFPIERDRI